MSKKHKDIIYLADGFNGLTIVNGSDPLNPVILSQTPYQGWAMKLCYSDDEKYLFMAQLVTNHLLIYDISDLKNPFVLQSFNELNAVGYNTQVKKDLSYLFLLAGDG